MAGAAGPDGKPFSLLAALIDTPIQGNKSLKITQQINAYLFSAGLTEGGRAILEGEPEGTK